MRILIDGHKTSTNIRTSKELLLMLKDLSRTFQWKTRYNPSEEIVHIITQDMPELPTLPIPLAEPISKRLEGQIICIDAGHGGSDCGSQGPNGTYEKEHTLAIAQLLRNLLEENGASIVMTRTTDDSPPSYEESSDDTRIAIANDANADFFLSIHADGFYPRPLLGSTVYYYQDDSRIAAELISDALSAEQVSSAATISFGSLPLLRYSKMPSVWVNVASLDNPEEELLITSQDGRTKIALALYRGITHFFRV